ncbi:MAG: hypothetical protein LC798_19395 [Chloroflexi bacterium]|nr:hypothetical protein [Chloroflexota bacterium]
MTLITSKEAGMAYPHERDESGVVTTKNVNADNQAGDPEEAQAVTGRPNDTAPENSTFASRTTTTTETTTKAVESDEAENKAVKRTTRKSSR